MGIITQEQIKENLKRVDEGKALTIPLVILDGIFKKEYFSDKEYKSKLHKEYYEKNKDRLKEYKKNNKDKIAKINKEK